MNTFEFMEKHMWKIWIVMAILGFVVAGFIFWLIYKVVMHYIGG